MRLFITGSAAVAAVVALAVWASGRPVSTLDRIQRSGVARVGYANEPPFAYRGADGRVTGESAEIAREILRELGVRKVEWVPVEFGALIPALKADQFDLIAAGMFRTPERRREIAFSIPTYSARTALLVRRGDESRTASYERLRTDATARLAVLEGTYELTLARAAGMPDERLFVVPDLTAGVAAIRSGRVDAMALTAEAASDLEASLGDSRLRTLVLPDTVIGGMPAIGHGAFGFRHEDDDLREAFDARLRPFLGSARHLAILGAFGLMPASQVDAGAGR